MFYHKFLKVTFCLAYKQLIKSDIDKRALNNLLRKSIKVAIKVTIIYICSRKWISNFKITLLMRNYDEKFTN